MHSVLTPSRAAARSLGRMRTVALFSLFVVSSGLASASEPALTLDEAIRLAVSASASAKASRASVEASTQVAARADQLPDPMLKVGIDNLPVTGPDRFSPTADFMTMRRIGVEQQWVSRDKRQARSARAQRAVEANEGVFLEKVASVREETGKAWLVVLYKQRALRLAKLIENEMQQDLGAVAAAHRGAKASASDVVQARMELFQSKDDINAAEQGLDAALIGLRRWTRLDVTAVADKAPELIVHVPNIPPAELEKFHPAVLNARRSISLADAETGVAVQERKPDWSFEAGFAQRGSQYSNMVSFGVSIPITVNRAQRQDRDIAEKSALGTKARLEYEDALVDMQSQIQALSSQLANTKNRIAQLKSELLPAAAEQVELATAAYRSGSGSLTGVFKARRISLEKQLQVNELEKEAALLWANLELHVISHDMTFATEAGK